MKSRPGSAGQNNPLHKLLALSGQGVQPNLELLSRPRTSRKASIQCGGRTPYTLSSFEMSSLDDAGLAAGVGYCEVEIGITRAYELSRCAARRNISEANPAQVVSPALAI